MTTVIITRASKGDALTFEELDSNFINLQTTADAALEAVNQLSGSQLSGTSSLEPFVVVKATTIPNQVIDSNDVTGTTTLKYLMQIKTDIASQSEEILVMYDGSNTYITEYAVLNAGTPISTFSVDVVSGFLQLSASPLFPNTTYSFIKLII